MKMLAWCWLTRTHSWGSARAALIPWAFEGPVVAWLEGFVPSARQYEKIKWGRSSAFRPASPSCPSIKANPNLHSDEWCEGNSRSAGVLPVLVGFLMPVCHRQRTVFLMDGLTVNGGNMHLVASTKKRNQKLSYWDLVENLYSINFRDIFAEILYLEGGWAMPPFNYYS